MTKNEAHTYYSNKYFHHKDFFTSYFYYFNTFINLIYN